MKFCARTLHTAITRHMAFLRFNIITTINTVIVTIIIIVIIITFIATAVIVIMVIINIIIVIDYDIIKIPLFYLFFNKNIVIVSKITFPFFFDHVRRP